MGGTAFYGAVACILLLVATPGIGLAQSGTSISGVLSDPQGARVPGATITLLNKSTGASRTAISDETGAYAFPQLSPGKYSIKAELQGFKTVVADDVEAPIGVTTRADLKFTEVGGITETVTVRGTTANVNTTDATVGNTFSENQIRQLPMEGRNVVGLLSLQPGVTYIGDTENARNGSVNGGKSDQANVALDGVDVNDQQRGLAFTSVLRVTLDSIQEFRVTTTNALADQGRSSGAQVSLVTKSGTNNWHGSAYEYHRNTVTTANEFFNNSSGVKRPALLRNVFGASAGGPFVKDRFFIFANYEGRRDARADSAVRTIPGADMRNGILRYVRTGGQQVVLQPDDIRRLDPGGIGPSAAALAVFKTFPLPNDNTVGDGINTFGYRFTSPIHLKYDTYIARLDYNLTADTKHALFWRGNLQNDRRTGLQQFPDTQSNETNLENSKGFALGYTYLIKPSLTNSFRWGFTRQGVETSGAAPGIPIISFRTLSDRFGTTRSSGRILPVQNFVDDVIWVRGTHTIGLGANLRFIRNDRFNFANSFHSASTNASWLVGTGADLRPADIISGGVAFSDAMMATLGIISQVNARYNYEKTGNAQPAGSPVLRRYGADEYEGYIQDSWRARSNLTLTFGVRYLLGSPPYETNGTQVAPTPSLGEWFNLRGTNMLNGIPSNAAPVVKVDLAGPKNGKPGFYDWDKNNFGPRFAFAWSPGFTDGWMRSLLGGPGKSAIRGGFSLTYSHIGSSLAISFDQGGSFGLSTGLTNPSSTQTSATAPRFTGQGQLPAALLPPAPPGGFPQIPPVAGQPGTFAITQSIDNTIRTPYTMQMNFSIQRELGAGFSFEAAFVGALGRSLLVNSDLAMPLDLKDLASGDTYFSAATKLVQGARNGATFDTIQRIPYWENLFPDIAANQAAALAVLNGRFRAGQPLLAAGTPISATQFMYRVFNNYAGPDYTTGLQEIDVICRPLSVGGRAPCSKFGAYSLFNDQYSALSGWRSIMNSNFHSLQVLLRKRFSKGMQFDFNYTFSKSFDLASSVERDGSFSGFLVNSWSPGQRRAVSDFDLHHSVNLNYVAELPFGRGKAFAGNVASWADQIIGGWQFSGIYRQTSGLAVGVGNGRFWPTNWNITGFATRTGNIPLTATTKNAAPALGTGTAGPNIFPNPATALTAYRNTDPGETGTRNDLRGDGYFGIDMGLAKSFRLPWENHRIQFRWEVFNLTNTVRFDVYSLTLDLGSGRANFGKYSNTLTNPRVMQFALRYEF